MADRLDQPREVRSSLLRRPRFSPDAFGRISESIARFMGTPRFLLWLTIFALAWLAWNSWGPSALRFDKAENGFTALTLMLSLQASYAAPLILLAQNRQDARDRVAAEQDRRRAERSLADTEFLAREMASLRIALGEVATRDFVRSELRNLMEEMEEARAASGAARGAPEPRPEGADQRAVEARGASDGSEGRGRRT
ncbi:DUF1003 domain-containing protein [Cellulomonas carbonis]|uniref:Membrane protein n=1 Tax=Cellulomonas carbonis T26 TaxID=947969 RepID=A0A0A0BN74_9CELL|nr:DUF1003 domain-containing protein [Cellulomonas carbonis]KGM09953.1 membrane protein [Cellulomonas carbonis T26]GGC16676.1 hypothetical protein GCM10010972_32490 [Cellulomonas carbonis]